MSDTDALPVGETTADAPEGDIPGLTAPEASEAPAETPKEPKMVSYDALHEERQRRKELQQENQRIQRDQAERDQVLQQRLDRLTEAIVPRQPQINYQDDPTAYIALQNQAVQNEVQQLRQQMMQRDQQEAAVHQAHQFKSFVANVERDFAQQQPDYLEAVTFARNNRLQQLQVTGLSPQQAEEYLQREVVGLIQSAYQRGENFAEIGYNYAKTTGYQPKARSTIETTQRGLEASKSLSGSGAKPGGMPQAEALARMTNEEFDAYLAKNKGAWEKLAG